MTQDMAAIKRWQGNQIKNAKKYVDEYSFVQKRRERRENAARVERPAGHNVVYNAVTGSLIGFVPGPTDQEASAGSGSAQWPDYWEQFPDSS